MMARFKRLGKVIMQILLCNTDAVA